MDGSKRSPGGNRSKKTGRNPANENRMDEEAVRRSIDRKNPVAVDISLSMSSRSAQEIKDDVKVQQVIDHLSGERAEVEEDELLSTSELNEQPDESSALARGGDAGDHQEGDSYLSPDAVIKHPLQNSWAMWFFKNDKNNKEWKDNLRVITTIDTVEDFWALYNHILPASKLPTGCDYSVFKVGIEPMWEDPQNKRGGRWLINLNKQQRNTHLDDFWLETLLCLIGEGFDEHSEEICGATVNIRGKGDKLGLWTRDASKNEATKKIGFKLKESLNVPPKVSIGFQAHSDTAGKSGSTIKNRYTV